MPENTLLKIFRMLNLYKHLMMEYIVAIFFSILLVIVHTASPQNNSGERCSHWFYWDDDSHQCQSCPVGYFGPSCSLPCRYPSYGAKCQQKCNCTEDYCTSDKGCLNNSNCEPGYYGRDCSTPCRYPSYGDRCQSHCDCTKTQCNHITGCQFTTDSSTDIILISVPTEEDQPSTAVTENLQTIIIIGSSIVIGLIVLFVSIIIVLVKRNKQSKRKTEPDCDFDSEFSSYQSIHDDTEKSTTSERYCSNIHKLNGKQTHSPELEIYENTTIREKMRP